MGTRAGAVGEGLGHERREMPVLACDFVGHDAEEDEAVGHGECVAVREVDLELASCILVVERVDVPTEFVHGLDEFAQPAHVVEGGRHVVAGLAEVVAVADLGGSVGRVLQDEELGLDAQVESVSEVGGRGELPLEDVAGRGLERLSGRVQAAREVGVLAVPRQLKPPGEVGAGGQLLVTDVLWQSVQRGAGEQFRSAHHVVEVVDRNELALRIAVHVDETGDRVPDSGRPQLLLHRFDVELGFGGGHGSSSGRPLISMAYRNCAGTSCRRGVPTVAAW